MPDWRGVGLGVADLYRTMAERQLDGVSPSYAAICRGVAADPELAARLTELTPPKRQPNLLLGAVRFLGGPVASWPAFRAFTLERWDDVRATMLARRTQTNEPGRCATMLPLLVEPAQPIALFEVGASMGLCLYPDRYAYRYSTGGAAGGGPVLGGGPVVLDCAVSGPAPLPGRPEVAWRGGLDLNPLDVRSDEDVRWLEALVWPEQVERFDRLQAAVAIARADPPSIVGGDLTSDLAAAVAPAPAELPLVIVHSAVLGYVDATGRAEFVAAVRALAESRPVRWISNEAPGVVPGTALDASGPARFVLARDGEPVARTGPHGQCLEWLG